MHTIKSIFFLGIYQEVFDSGCIRETNAKWKTTVDVSTEKGKRVENSVRLVELTANKKISNLLFLNVSVKVNFVEFLKSSFFDPEEGPCEGLHRVNTKTVSRRPACDYEITRSIFRRKLGKKRLILRDLIDKKEERKKNQNKKDLA